MPMLISLVICTYNRADILRATLPSVLDLKIPDKIEFELVIVDNNSSDSTKEFSKNFIEKYKTKVNARYVFEVQQGLSYARNKGYIESKGDYIVYIDDECILPEQWLAEAIKEINERKPAFIGGPYYGKYLPGSTSSWYKESFGDSYILQYDLPNGPMVNRYLSGGNLFIRRDVFEKIGSFDVNLGMTGETISYGEEVELQKRFIEKYPEELIWYSPKIFLWHCIRDMKMKIPFLFKDALIRGASSAELVKHDKKRLQKAPLHLAYFTFKAISSSLTKLFKSITANEHFFLLLYEDYKSGTWRDIGGAWYRTKLLFSARKNT